MDKEKSNKQIITIFYFFISMISCSNMYENNISDILCVQDVSVISSKRYESHAIGEWYILERYVLFGDTAIQLDVNKDIEVCDIKRHPTLEDYYWTGWNPISINSSIHNILLESTSFHSNNLLVREYEKCCYGGDVCYYTILVRDSTELHNDLYEKTVVVYDASTNTLYVCNYNY